MKRNLIFLLTLVTSLGFAINENTTLMTIGQQNISLGEFEYLYQKNNQITSADTSSLEEYIDLFANFKLKVIAAEDAGYDTVPSFIKELDGYREQLAEPYLKDQDLSEKLLHEAYDRMKEEVEASHILFSIKSDAPEDTLAAYNKALKARDEIINGTDFKDVAKKYSEDPSAAANGGYLGYFSAFQMVLPFEEAAYNTPVGEISMPFRSKFGYHILEVHNRRKTQGEVNISHILLLANDQMSETVLEEKEKEIYNIYNELVNGADFEKIAKEKSEDHGSSVRGGNIGFIKSGQTIAPFEEAAFALKNKGDISAPVHTRFGWHIIRLDGKKGLSSYEEKEADIRRRLARDERGNKPELIFINKLKKEYNFKINTQAIDDLYTKVKGKTPDSLFTVMLNTLQDTVITYGNSGKTQKDFAQYCLKKSPKSVNFASHFADFEKDALINYEKSRLELKYEDFRYLMNEYHDGLLLFEISNNMIWSKASEDKEGLAKFYKKNKKNYLFNDSCYHADIIYIKDSSVNQVYLSLKDTMTMKAIKDSLNKKEEMIKTESGFYTLGDNAVVDAKAFGKTNKNINEKFNIITMSGKRYDKGDIKPLDATRGACISDYQEFLEDKWIKKLRRQYKIKVNKEVLSQLN